MRKKTAAIFLILALLMVLFFTFQNPEKSRILSESVRMWLGNIGIQVEYKSLRSNIHILEYFIVGLAVCGVVRRNWLRIVIGCGIGVIDEGIKAPLLGREFEVRDLKRNFIGVITAVVLVSVITKRSLIIKCWDERCEH